MDPINPDFFSITLENGDILDVTATTTATDLSLQLLDAAGNVIDSDLTSPFTVGVHHSGPDEDYVIEARSTLDACIEYSLSLDFDFCLDDPHEPNDDFTSALPLPDPSTDLVVSKNSPDFFSLTVPAGQAVSIDFLFSDAYGDIDAELFDLAGTSLDSSTSFTDNEHLEYVNLTGTDVEVIAHVELSSFGSHNCNFYDVVVTFIDQECTVDDAYAGNHSIATAAAINGPISDLNVDPINADYFSFSMDDGDAVAIEAIPDSGDLRLYLYDSTGTEIASDGYPPYEFNRNHAGPTETYTLGVETPDFCIDYTLEFDLQSSVCADDRFAPNHTAADAAPITASEQGLIATAANPHDWFSVIVPAYSQIVVDLLLDANTDSDLYFYDPSNTSSAVVSSRTIAAGASERVTWANTTAVDAEMLIRTEYWDYASNNPAPCATYDLELAFLDLECADEDDYAGNHSFADAEPINGPVTDLLVDMISPDFFSVELGDGDGLLVEALPDAGDVVLTLYDSAHTQIERDSSAPFTTSVLHSGLPETYFIQVEADDACISYDLDLDVQVEVCADDRFSPNHTAADAAPITGSQYGLIATTAQVEDWFSVIVPANSELVVDLLLNAVTDIDLYLYDPSNTGTAMASSTSTTAGVDEQVTWTNITAADVEMLIRTRYWDYASSNPFPCATYDLELTFNP